MKRILILVLILASFGCSKRPPKLNNREVNVDVSNMIVLKNKSGQNLLDPNVPDYYPHDSIYVFKLDSLGNKVVLQKNPVRSSQNRCFLVFNESGLGLGHVFQKDITTFLQLTKTDVDTVKVEYGMFSGSHYNTKLWYNGVLKWTRGDKWPVVVIKENR